MFSLGPRDSCEDAAVSAHVPDTSWTISWQNCVPFGSFVFSPLVPVYWPCQNNTSLSTCLTGQPAWLFWYFLTVSSLFPRCCQAHDHCYSEAKEMASCKFIWDSPYTEIYHYDCSDGEITCSSTSISTSLCFERYSSLSSEERGCVTLCACVPRRRSASPCQGGGC